MKNETWETLFGHTPNREMKMMVMEEVKSTGADIREVIAKYVLPTMAILNEQGLFQYEGRMITPEEWHATNPLGEYGKLIIVRL